MNERINQAASKLELEDIYLPYRPRRRSLATQAREAGLEPIALAILNDSVSPASALSDYQAPAPLQDDNGEAEASIFEDKENSYQVSAPLLSMSGHSSLIYSINCASVLQNCPNS